MEINLKNHKSLSELNAKIAKKLLVSSYNKNGNRKDNLNSLTPVKHNLNRLIKKNSDLQSSETYDIATGIFSEQIPILKKRAKNVRIKNEGSNLSLNIQKINEKNHSSTKNFNLVINRFPNHPNHNLSADIINIANCSTSKIKKLSEVSIKKKNLVKDRDLSKLKNEESFNYSNVEESLTAATYDKNKSLAAVIPNQNTQKLKLNFDSKNNLYNIPTNNLIKKNVEINKMYKLVT